MSPWEIPMRSSFMDAGGGKLENMGYEKGGRCQHPFGLSGRDQCGAGAGIFRDRYENPRVGEGKQGDPFLRKRSLAAAAAAAIRSGRTKQKVNIEMPGGMLEVEWDSDGADVSHRRMPVCV